jgi:hypothetical protein
MVAYLFGLAVVPIAAAVAYQAGYKHGVRRNRRRRARLLKDVRELATAAIAEIGPELRLLAKDLLAHLARPADEVKS